MAIIVGTYATYKTVDTVPTPLSANKYGVVGTNSINLLRAMGVDVYTLSYKHLGLDRSIYESSSVDEVIVTLEDSTGKTILVPEKYLIEVSSPTGISYTAKALVISLGDHPQYRNFSQLITLLNSSIEEYEGITPAISLTDVSSPVYVDLDRHTVLQATRANRSAGVRSPLRRLAERELELEEKSIRIHALELFIRDYMESCAVNCIGDGSGSGTGTGSGGLDGNGNPITTTVDTLIDVSPFSFSQPLNNLIHRAHLTGV